MASTRDRIVICSALGFGIFVLIIVAPMYLSSLRQPESVLMKVAGGAYFMTLLPAALLAVASRKASGLWMLLVSALAIAALWSHEILRFLASGRVSSLIAGLLGWGVVVAIPSAFGVVLLRSKRVS